MKFDFQSIGKAFAPRYIAKAMQAFDKVTMVVVSVCWGAALVLMVLAMYTVHLSLEAKRQVVEAAATEPSLPKMVSRAPEAKDIAPLVERLQKRFSDINFTLANDRTLTIYTADGAKFRAWLTVLSYVDTISPQYRWTIKSFCVGGQCPGNVPMKAVLSAQKVSFTAPSVKIE